MRQRQCEKFQIQKAKAIYVDFLRSTKFGKFCLCFYYRRGMFFLQGLVLALNFSVWELTPEVNFSKSHKTWES